jgi:hypothetical protein
MNDDKTGWKLWCVHCADYKGYFIKVGDVTVAHSVYALPGDITGFVIPSVMEAVKEVVL